MKKNRFWKKLWQSDINGRACSCVWIPFYCCSNQRHKIRTTITMKQSEKVLDSVLDLFLKEIRKRLDIFDPLS